MLARPSYGERWGRHWLDVVRYAETNGYERDATKPNAWRYRDYVIRAFNQDKPFDRFILEQLAGDELPDSSAETFIASGYYSPWALGTMSPPTRERGSLLISLTTLSSTTSQAFLGLTLGCARCHNHKFEALTARDYYSMVAIFNGLERPRKEASGAGSCQSALGPRSTPNASVTTKIEALEKKRKGIAEAKE